MSSFPPIADYGLLSDCEVNALVAPDGSVEWLCLPRPDSPSVFGALLDRSAGSFRFGPSSAEVPHDRRYIPGTMVLETTWHTPTGWLLVQDLLVMEPTERSKRRVDYRRAPSDYSPAGTLLRLATCLSGRVEVAVDCFPQFEYGAAQGSWAYKGEGYGSMIVHPPKGDPEMELVSSIGLGPLGERAYGRSTLELAAGHTSFVALSWDGSQPSSVEEAFEQLHGTIDIWRDWLSNAKVPDHRWRRYIERSALTLKGLSYAPTGAILAAATTSLPETPGGARNWDYRFTWIRDSSFMLQSLFRLGFDWEALEYFAFVMETVAGEKDAKLPWELQLMYGIGGERELTEHTLDHLSGYGGARPVRIGNAAYDQKQLDVWGMLLDAVETAFHRIPIAKQTWAGISSLVDAAVEHWHDPDQGIWEVRGDPQQFTASKVMCWVAADRGAKLARERDDTERAERWQSAADEMKSEVLDKGVNDHGVFRQAYDNDELDASLLLIPLLGFLPPDDDRVKATVLAVATDLTQGDLVLRYRVDTTDTGFSGEEGTFTICSFWLVSALALIGEIERARALCEKLLSFAGPLLLYAEEIDASTGLHLGNFPQTFTHLALIDALTRLIDAESAARAS